MHNTSISYAQKLDREDPLNTYRKKFRFPEKNGKPQIYFLGNSLGLQPVNTSAGIIQILEQWQSDGVESFFRGDDPWLNFHDHLTGPLAEMLGTKRAEISIMNQLTVNLHLMLISFYRPEGKRKKILCEAKAFPSDQYMLETHVQHYGFDPADTIIEVQPRNGEVCIRHEDILKAIDEHKDEIALVLWGAVNYYTGQVFNIKEITAAAQHCGAKAGFDLAHAAGNIEMNLHDWNVDFACWCNYKYLNAGPGAVGGAYIHERYHRDLSVKRFAGWWGYEKSSRFLMEKGFKPIDNAEGWQLSTPSPILHSCLRSSLEIFHEAGWKNLLIKRKTLNDYAWWLLAQLKSEPGAEIMNYLTPVREQGCQISIKFEENGREIFDTLGEKGIMADWREPGVIRIAPVPLYNSYEDVWHFYATLKGILK